MLSHCALQRDAGGRVVRVCIARTPSQVFPFSDSLGRPLRRPSLFRSVFDAGQNAAGRTPYYFLRHEGRPPHSWQAAPSTDCGTPEIVLQGAGVTRAGLLAPCARDLGSRPNRRPLFILGTFDASQSARDDKVLTAPVRLRNTREGKDNV